MMSIHYVMIVAALAMQGGVRAPDRASVIAPTDLPVSARAAIEAVEPGMRVTAIERKQREGRVYLDVEGMRADGEAIELDLLAEGDEFTVVEIQRDIAWDAAPDAARRAVAASGQHTDPVRVIESRQTDGSIIYELFAPGRPERPAIEVKTVGEQATILTEEWPH